MEKAKDFCLPDPSGNEICLKDFLGKFVVLYFYPKDNTSGCTQEACDFTSSISEFEALDCAVVGISPDGQKSHKKFIEKHGLNIILLSDESKEVLKNYGVWQKKSMYGREYMGVMRTTLLINPRGEIEKRWDKVKVSGHVQEVKNELQARQKAKF